VISERLDDAEEIARSLHSIAENLRDTGAFERAAELLTRSIEIRRAHGLGDRASSLHSLGDLFLDTRDMPAADRYYREALAAAVQDEEPRTQAYCLAGLACVAARNQDATAAGRLWTLAERLEHEIGFQMLATERARYERNLTRSLRDSPGYRAGVQSATNLDPLTVAPETIHS
jgi:hypothetical protein